MKSHFSNLIISDDDNEEKKLSHAVQRDINKVNRVIGLGDVALLALRGINLYLVPFGQLVKVIPVVSLVANLFRYSITLLTAWATPQGWYNRLIHTVTAIAALAVCLPIFIFTVLNMPSIAISFGIVMATADVVRDVWVLGALIKSRFSGGWKRDIQELEHDKEEFNNNLRQFAQKKLIDPDYREKRSELNKLYQQVQAGEDKISARKALFASKSHALFLSGAFLLGMVMLLVPPLAPLGMPILLGVGVYTVFYALDIPASWATRIRNKLASPKKLEPLDKLIEKEQSTHPVPTLTRRVSLNDLKQPLVRKPVVYPLKRNTSYTDLSLFAVKKSSQAPSSIMDDLANEELSFGAKIPSLPR